MLLLFLKYQFNGSIISQNCPILNFGICNSWKWLLIVKEAFSPDFYLKPLSFLERWIANRFYWSYELIQINKTDPNCSGKALLYSNILIGAQIIILKHLLLNFQSTTLNTSRQNLWNTISPRKCFELIDFHLSLRQGINCFFKLSLIRPM